jgi:hypothetical protein
MDTFLTFPGLLLPLLGLALLASCGADATVRPLNERALIRGEPVANVGPLDFSHTAELIEAGYVHALAGLKERAALTCRS